MDPQEKYNLITKGLAEVLGDEKLKNILNNEKRDLSIYWGTATTGRPHCGYFVPMVKLAHFLKAGCRVKVLLADIHGFLDNLKAPIELVNERAKYYEKIIKAILTAIGVPLEKLEFILGSSYQLSPKYAMDVYKICAITSERDARKAGAEVVKQVDNALLSGLVYPLLQALDEEYLDVDIQFGGVDQRKIFTFAKEALPKLGYKERIHLMNPMVPGLAGGKMSASEENSKIDLLDDEKAVKKKINSAVCAPGVVDGNGLLAFIENVLFPIYELRGQEEMIINRDEKWGGIIRYASAEQLIQDYKDLKLSPEDVKLGLRDAINEILTPIRNIFDKDVEFQEIEKRAYPPPAPKIKKVKTKQKKEGNKTTVSEAANE